MEVIDKDQIKVAADQVADEIRTIANAMKAFSETKLKRDVVYHMIQRQARLRHTKISIADIKTIINVLEDLEKDHLK